MSQGDVITLGRDPDPAHRLRTSQGAKLRTTRELRGLSQHHVARIMERNGVTITPQAISQWERGETTPRPHMRVAVARALDIAPSTIWNLDDEAAA